MTESPEHEAHTEPTSTRALRFLTLRRAAQELATTDTTIRALNQRGELPPSRSAAAVSGVSNV